MPRQSGTTVLNRIVLPLSGLSSPSPGAFSVVHGGPLITGRCRKKIDWPTSAWRRRRYKLMLLWDLLHGRGPPNLVKHIPKPVSDRCNFALRNACSIETALCRTSHRSSSFLPASIALFNSLPLSVLSCTSRSMFFTELNKHFSHDKFTFGLT